MMHSYLRTFHVYVCHPFCRTSSSWSLSLSLFLYLSPSLSLSAILSISIYCYMDWGTILHTTCIRKPEQIVNPNLWINAYFPKDLSNYEWNICICTYVYIEIYFLHYTAGGDFLQVSFDIIIIIIIFFFLPPPRRFLKILM